VKGIDITAFASKLAFNAVYAVGQLFNIAEQNKWSVGTFVTDTASGQALRELCCETYPLLGPRF
jgi:hypothetical protein